MQKRALIKVIGTQRFPEGDEDKLEFTTEGSYHMRRGVFYLVYKESEVTGMEGATTTLRVENEYVVLNRMGSMELKQEFRPGFLHRSSYVTPYGTLWLSVITDKVESDLTAQGGRITLEYNLYIDDQLVSHNGLTIIIKEEPPQ